LNTLKFGDFGCRNGHWIFPSPVVPVKFEWWEVVAAGGFVAKVRHRARWHFVNSALRLFRQVRDSWRNESAGRDAGLP